MSGPLARVDWARGCKKPLVSRNAPYHRCGEESILHDKLSEMRDIRGLRVQEPSSKLLKIVFPALFRKHPRSMSSSIAKVDESNT